MARVTNAIKAYPAAQSIQDAIFVSVLLVEPRKEFVLEWEQNGGPLDRKARALLYRNLNNETYEGIVDVATGAVESFQKLNFVGVPSMTQQNEPWLNGYFTQDELNALFLKPDILKLLAKYKITATDIISGNVRPDLYYTFEAFRNFTNCANCTNYIPRDAPNFRYYPGAFLAPNVNPGCVCVPTANWAYVEGLAFIIDANNKTLYKIITEPLPPDAELPVPPAVPDPYPFVQHPPMKPLCTFMPEGPSFTVTNKVVKWDNWEFQYSWQRSGLTLYNIYYTENGAKRKILYKAAAVESMVVYNSAEPLIERAYISGDAFNYPILDRLIHLRKGLDIPTYAYTDDITVWDCCGNPWIIKDGIGIYEQETDLLWRVTEGVISSGWPDPSRPPVAGARRRQLVVRTIFSGFYYFWVYSYIFNQDGSMEFYIDLGGQTTNQWVKPGTDSLWGQRISKQYLALNHTHSFVYRLDFDIDGTNNTVMENNSYPINNMKVNKCGDVVRSTDTVLKTEKEAIRDTSQKRNRAWMVINPNSMNRLGHPRGYAIMPYGPNGNGKSNANDCSLAHTHFPWLKHNVHVTKYRYGEEYASGDFPILANRPTGMPVYLKNNDNLENEDIVFWYTINFFHEPHTEDYPFISTVRTGVQLMPHNFFGINPATSINGQVLSCDVLADCNCTATTQVPPTACSPCNPPQ
jgi:primary-amine oxidase